MSGNKGNINSSISKFIDYFRDLLRGRERNAFERNLERDPFEREAMEGFQFLSPEELEVDMKQLDRQLTRRLKRTNRIMIYRMVAGIAVILTLSISYLLIFDKQIEELPENFQVSESIEEANMQTEKSDAVPAEAPILNQPTSIDKELIVSEIDEDKSESASDNTRTILSEEKAIDVASVPLVETLVVIQDENTAGLSLEFNDDEEILTEETTEEFAFQEFEEEASTKSEEISIPMTEAVETAFASQKSSSRAKKAAIPVSMSTEEFAVANNEGYNTFQSDSFSYSHVSGGVETDLETVKEKMFLEPEYIPASPVIGIKKYRKYIKKNIRFPENFPEQEKAVVFLKFILDEGGKADHFRIIESPDTAFSKEAIRLVDEGPLWIPPIRFGVYSAEETRLRIVFNN